MTLVKSLTKGKGPNAGTCVSVHAHMCSARASCSEPEDVKWGRVQSSWVVFNFWKESDSICLGIPNVLYWKFFELLCIVLWELGSSVEVLSWKGNRGVGQKTRENFKLPMNIIVG